MKIAFLLLLLSNIASAQTSILYNNSRSLKVDNSFKIDEFTFSNIANIEKELLPRIYNAVRYPAMAKENNISGTVIIQLLINDGDGSFEIAKSSNKIFNDPALKALKSIYPQVVFPPKGKLLLYVPLKFEVIQNTYKNTLNRNHAVTIQTNDAAPVTTVIN
jgi:TonB family protein